VQPELAVYLRGRSRTELVDKILVEDGEPIFLISRPRRMAGSRIGLASFIPTPRNPMARSRPITL
jgi:hypothetical protein